MSVEKREFKSVEEMYHAYENLKLIFEAQRDTSKGATEAFTFGGNVKFFKDKEFYNADGTRLKLFDLDNVEPIHFVQIKDIFHLQDGKVELNIYSKNKAGELALDEESFAELIYSIQQQILTVSVFTDDLQRISVKRDRLLEFVKITKYTPELKKDNDWEIQNKVAEIQSDIAAMLVSFSIVAKEVLASQAILNILPYLENIQVDLESSDQNPKLGEFERRLEEFRSLLRSNLTSIEKEELRQKVISLNNEILSELPPMEGDAPLLAPVSPKVAIQESESFLDELRSLASSKNGTDLEKNIQLLQTAIAQASQNISRAKDIAVLLQKQFE